MLFVLSILSLLSLCVLAFMPGRFWKPLFDAAPAQDPASWPRVDIIVPARDEAEILPASLPALLAQDYPGPFRVILVDDNSTDDTGGVARRLAERKGLADRLLVLQAPALKSGWSGKVAAMQNGIEASDAPFVLFTDADILHPAFSLRRLVARAEADGLDLTSLMVRLNCVSWAEKFLVPAFIFFFGMLYPFRRANDPRSRVAAAAGGVMLLRRQALDKAGGLAAIRGALIDDCSLARAVKDSGGKISLTLSKDVKSLRQYPDFKDIHDMIARTAFNQLKHSALYLVLSLLGMALVFLVPVVASCVIDIKTALVGNVAYLVMALLYLPTVALYELPLYWAGTLPFAAVFYMVATLASARRTWAGKGGLWKGRMETR